MVAIRPIAAPAPGGDVGQRTGQQGRLAEVSRAPAAIQKDGRPPGLRRRKRGDGDCCARRPGQPSRGWRAYGSQGRQGGSSPMAGTMTAGPQAGRPRARLRPWWRRQCGHTEVWRARRESEHSGGERSPTPARSRPARVGQHVDRDPRRRPRETSARRAACRPRVARGRDENAWRLSASSRERPAPIGAGAAVTSIAGDDDRRPAAGTGRSQTVPERSRAPLRCRHRFSGSDDAAAHGSVNAGSSGTEPRGCTPSVPISGRHAAAAARASGAEATRFRRPVMVGQQVVVRPR